MSSRRHAHFLWIYLQGGLPFNHLAKCKSCQTNLSYDHIFFKCNILDQTRTSAIAFIRNYCPDIKWEETEILRTLARCKPSEPLTSLIPATLNALWIIFSKYNHEQFTNRIVWLRRELSICITANYLANNMIKRKKIEDVDKAKEKFILDWKIHSLWEKIGFSFQPNIA